MARNLKQLRRQSGMSREEWDYFMQTGTPPQNMSFEDASNLTQQRNNLNKTDGYVPPEDQQDFVHTGAGNEPYQDNFEYTGAGNEGDFVPEDVGEYVPENYDDRNSEYEQAVKDYHLNKEKSDESKPYAGGGVQGEQGNMYVAGMTDDIRRADYETNEAFNEAIVRRRHEKGHPNPYQSAEGAGFYLDSAKTHYVSKDILRQVDPYGLYPNILENMPDESQSVFASGSLEGNVVTVVNPDGTTKRVLTDPGKEVTLNEGEQIVDDEYVAPEDEYEEDEWGNEPTGYGDFPGTPTKPPPIRNPMTQNPMERNPMQFNPAANFGLLQPGTMNIPRALPTSDELN